MMIGGRMMGWWKHIHIHTHTHLLVQNGIAHTQPTKQMNWTELNWTELNQHEKPLSRTKGMYIYDSNLCSRVLFWRNWLYWNERRKPCLAAALPTLVHTGSCIYQPCGTLARLLLPFIHFSVYLFSCSPCTYTFYISTTRRNKKKENTIHNTSPSSNPFHLFHLLYYT